MGVSTKRGDDGYTNTLSGQRVSKYHVVTEAVGTLDEANSFLGLARASSKEKKIRRILLQVQKHLFIIGSELSVPKGSGKPPKKIMSETEVMWLERLIDDLEEALALPPGFMIFGQETCSAQMDVARSAVRKAERIAVKMNSEDMIGNPIILKYLNRLSDLIFVLACFEEKNDEERRGINKSLLYSRLSDPAARKLAIFISSIILILVAVVILILIFHKPAQKSSAPVEHMQEMENLH